MNFLLISKIKIRQFFRLSESGFCWKRESAGRCERNIFSIAALEGQGAFRVDPTTDISSEFFYSAITRLTCKCCGDV